MASDAAKAVSFELWSEVTALLQFLEGDELREILDALDVAPSEWAGASDGYVAEVLANEGSARTNAFALACAKAHQAGREAARARLDFIRQQFGRAPRDEGFEAVDETQLVAVAQPGVALPFGRTPSPAFTALRSAPAAEDDADAGSTAAFPALRDSPDDTLPFGKPITSKRKGH